MPLGKERFLRIFVIFSVIFFILLTAQIAVLPGNYTIKVIKSGSDVYISYRYMKNMDMHLVIGKCGANDLVGIKEIALDTNYISRILPWVTEEKDKFVTVCTDWVGPYTVKSLEHDDGGKPNFTGGWHGDKVDGKEEPTANTESFLVEIGGQELVDNNVYFCDNVKVHVVNYIQAYNTKKIDRNVIKEKVKYDITPKKVKVEVVSTALEKAVLKRYYGLQAQNGVFERIEYNNGISANCGENSDSGPYNKDNVADSFKLISKDSIYEMIVTLDTGFGLGDFEYLSNNNPTIFTQEYGKTYFNLINGVDKKVEKGDYIKWRGSYEFR